MITLRSKVFDILKDGAWHSPYDMAQQLETAAKAVSSRIRDLRLPEYGNYRIKAKRIEGNNFEYQMVNPPKPKPTVWADRITNGAGGTSGSTGGWITLTSGTSTGFGTGGSITITGGAGGSTSGGGGAITISGGSSTDFGNGGTVTLTGGSSGYNYASYIPIFSLPISRTVSNASQTVSNASGWARNYETLYNYKHNYEPLI